MSILLLLLAIMTPQDHPGFPYPEFSMKCYPETVMPGDTLCFMVVAGNPHTESIYIHDDYWPTTENIRTHLRDSENQEQTLVFEALTSRVPLRFCRPVEIPPGDSRIIAALAINVPALEDLKEPFWEKHLNNLSAGDVKLTLCVTLISYSSAGKNDNSTKYERLPFTLEVPFVMKQRPDSEMALIRQWHETSKPFFPDNNGYRKYGEVDEASLDSKNITVENEEYSHWYFVRLGNRLPGEPNVPSTWQGWKKLEESLTPSTMRDEIRLTRILIQYCDTQDPNVLDELKEWFAGMNEVQQACMAKSIWDRTRRYYGNHYMHIRDLYITIREYDIVGKSEFDILMLKIWRLLE